jgi:hypothetical protein
LFHAVAANVGESVFYPEKKGLAVIKNHCVIRGYFVRVAQRYRNDAHPELWEQETGLMLLLSLSQPAPVNTIVPESHAAWSPMPVA